MLVEHLIRELQKLDRQKVVVVGTPQGWANLGDIIDDVSVVYLSEDYTRPFSSE